MKKILFFILTFFFLTISVKADSLPKPDRSLIFYSDTSDTTTLTNLSAYSNWDGRSGYELGSFAQASGSPTPKNIYVFYSGKYTTNTTNIRVYFQVKYNSGNETPPVNIGTVSFESYRTNSSYVCSTGLVSYNYNTYVTYYVDCSVPSFYDGNFNFPIKQNIYLPNTIYTIGIATNDSNYTVNPSNSDVISGINGLGGVIDSQTANINSNNNNNTNKIIESQNQANETNKGIWQSIKDGFSNVGGWFSNLGSGVLNGLTSLGDRISGFFDKLLSGIIDGLKSLFIPEDDFFKDYFDSLYDFFNEKLGILIYPLDLLLDVLNRFLDLNNTTNGLIHIPSIEIGKFGEIIEEREFYLNEHWDEEPYKTIYDVYLVFVHAFIGFCLVRLADKKVKEIVGGQNSDN